MEGSGNHFLLENDFQRPPWNFIGSPKKAPTSHKKLG
jgi:hypothetical protein